MKWYLFGKTIALKPKNFLEKIRRRKTDDENSKAHKNINKKIDL
jgi:hypothetical protein